MFISVDAVEASAKTKASYEVPFPLLSDSDAKVHEAYEVVHELDGPTSDKLISMGLDVERWSKRKHHKIAIPSIFLVGQDGLVKWAHAARDYKTRPEFDALLAAVEKALKS